MTKQPSRAHRLVRLGATIAFTAAHLGGCSGSRSGSESQFTVKLPVALPDGVAGGHAGATGAAGSSASAARPALERRSTGSTALPCAADEAVRRNCQSCHAAVPRSGVPMALVTWEDFQQPAVSNPTLAVHRMADLRVHDAAAPMPPAPQKLPAQDRAALQAWLASGAPAGTDPSCAPAPTDEGTGTAAPDVGADPPADLGECYELLAHDFFDRALPYAVNDEHYVNFHFDAPWPADAQGIRFESVFDEHPEILHHWLLYVAGSEGFPFPQPDGTVEPNTNGSHFGATLVAGWAPGGTNGVNLPPDVGLDINGGSRKLVLEIHFFSNSAVMSRSGVKVCTSKAPRPNLATVSWLGTETISLPAGQVGTASGTCAPSTNQPIHVLRSWPHMHGLGTHMTTVIKRAAGGSEVLLDEDFNFNTQFSYDTPATLQPGDTLTTTCTFQNDTTNAVGYGTRTGDEMCFNFVTAYPANLLQHGSAMNGAANPCMN